MATDLDNRIRIRLKETQQETSRKIKRRPRLPGTSGCMEEGMGGVDGSQSVTWMLVANHVSVAFAILEL